MIRSYGSRHYDIRSLAVDLVILHYTETRDVGETLSIFESQDSKVSAHYLIDVNGDIYALVDELHRAWHAGVSFWGGVTDLNSCSLGIELQNPGHAFGYVGFSDSQMSSLLVLLDGIVSRHKIRVGGFLGHSDIAPGRKKDPGEKFDWRLLSERGFGLYPSLVGSYVGDSADAGDLGLLLERLGYGGASVEDCIIAFQRHYRPSLVNGVSDSECIALAKDLLQFICV